MYKTADVVIFCFSLAGLKIPKKRGGADENIGDGIQITSSHLSLRGIRNQWLPEVAEIIKPTKDESTEDSKLAEKEKESEKEKEKEKDKESE